MEKRILVVDDDVMMTRTLKEILELQGWKADIANDGAIAVEAVSMRRYDVVLMDVKMPGMNGVDAFKEMKRVRPDIKVVLMTAYAAQELISDAEDNGVLKVLSKPVDIRSLLAFLAGMLSRKRPVLVVDSDRDFLRTLSDSLALAGFEVVIASGIAEALRLMGEARPAAILLHMHMESASARDAVLAVHEVSPEVALILYSGQPGAVMEINGLVPREYVHSYLQKPFRVEEVADVLHDVVGP
jgi:two-component system response regulator HydG